MADLPEPIPKKHQTLQADTAPLISEGQSMKYVNKTDPLATIDKLTDVFELSASELLKQLYAIIRLTHLFPRDNIKV